MGTTFRPHQPDQILMLPPDLREWVLEGHLAHHVSDLVDADPRNHGFGWDGIQSVRSGVAQIRALAATRDHLFASVVLSGERDTVVLAYRSPFASIGEGQPSCHSAAFSTS